MRRIVPAILVTAIGTLTVAWVMSSVPFGAPDEASHYLRAYTIASGHLLGRKEPYNVALTPAQTAWVDKSTREVRVPAAMSPPNVGCRDGRPDVSAQGCEEVTEVGNYQPLAYLLPAAGLAVSSDATTGLWTTRFLSALPCAVLIGLAILVLWDGTLASIIGLNLALSPMVFFVASVLNPNGLEIAASAALLAGLLRLARGPTAGGGRWVWALVAVAAVITALAWQLGPAFLVIDSLVAILAIGPLSLWGFIRRQRRALAVVLLVAVAALLLYVVYGRISDSTHLHIGLRPIRANLKLGYEQLAPVLRDSVGNFGALTVNLPPAVRWVDWGAVIALICGALLLGGWVGRIKLVLVTIAALAFPIAFFAFVYQYTGFGMQGRYMLPVEMVIPIYAGEVLWQSLATGSRTRYAGAADGLVRIGFVVVGALQVVAWWINARTVSGAHGLFPGVAWSPPLGWWPWIVLAVLGGVGIAGSALATQRLRPEPTG